MLRVLLSAEYPNGIGMVKLLKQCHLKVKDSTCPCCTVSTKNIGKRVMWVLRGLKWLSKTTGALP